MFCAAVVVWRFVLMAVQAYLSVRLLVLVLVQVQLPVLPPVLMAALPYLLVRQFVLVPVQTHLPV